MSVLFLNAQPTAEFSGHTDRSRTEKRQNSLEESNDKFNAHMKNSSDKTEKTDKTQDTQSTEKTSKSTDSTAANDTVKTVENDNAGVLFIQNTQGQTVKLPLNAQQLEYASNLDRVALVDPEILEQFGGLASFMEAIQSLIPGNPELSEVDIVYLPYQIEALNQEIVGSETFPHLIVANLSPVQLNALEKMDSHHASISAIHEAAEIDSVPAGELINVLLTPSRTAEPTKLTAPTTADLPHESMTSEMAQHLRELQEVANTDEVAPELTLREIVGLAREQGRSPNGNMGLSSSQQNTASAAPQGGQGSVNSATLTVKKAPLEGSMTFGQAIGALLNSDLIPLDLKDQLTDFATSIVSLNPAGSPTSTPHGIMGSHQAGKPHQAAQVLAASLQNAAGNGGNQKLSVLLNPPDLGKVMVDIEIDAQNKLKISMVTEKEAAYTLLQKDTGFLEQTLQEAGLDIDSGDIDLSFSGQDSFMFEHENKDNVFDLYTNDPRNNANAENGDADIIETQVDIFRDPHIGHWQYNAVI